MTPKFFTKILTSCHQHHLQPLTSASEERRLSALEALTQQQQKDDDEGYGSPPLFADMDAAAMLLETFTQATNDDVLSSPSNDNKQTGVAQKRMGSVPGATSVTSLRQHAAYPRQPQQLSENILSEFDGTDDWSEIDIGEIDDFFDTLKYPGDEYVDVHDPEELLEDFDKETLLEILGLEDDGATITIPDDEYSDSHSDVERFEAWDRLLSDQVSAETKSGIDRGVEDLERALMGGVVPADAGVGNGMLPADFGFDPLELSTKDYFKQVQNFILNLFPKTKNWDQEPEAGAAIPTVGFVGEEDRPPALVLRDYREAEARTAGHARGRDLAAAGDTRPNIHPEVLRRHHRHLRGSDAAVPAPDHDVPHAQPGVPRHLLQRNKRERVRRSIPSWRMLLGSSLRVGWCAGLDEAEHAGAGNIEREGGHDRRGGLYIRGGYDAQTNRILANQCTAL